MALRKKRSEQLVSTSLGDPGVIPGRWSAVLGAITETQKVPLDVAPTPLSAVTVASSVQQRDNTNERLLTTVELGSPTGKSIVDEEYDELTGEVMDVTEIFVPAGTSGTALASDGTYSTVRQLNEQWSLKTTRKATALTTRNYMRSEYVSLPRVLTTFNAVAFTDKARLYPYADSSAIDRYYKTTGGNIIYAGLEIDFTDYSGEYEITVTETWQNTKFLSLTFQRFRPKGFYWTTPFNTGSVPDCLHAAVTITGTTGTTHPKYALTSWNYVFPATSPTTVTGTYNLSDRQEPFKGGWLRTTRNITIS